MPQCLLTMAGIVTVLLLVEADAHGAPQFPPAEQTMQDDVDHWGQAFSDQVRLFEARFKRFEGAAGKGELDYVLGVETPLRKTFPAKYCFKGQTTNVVEIAAGRNESEAFQLAILPRMGFELTDVSVTASDLAHVNDAQPIPASAVGLWRVGYVETTLPPYPTRHVGPWPDPLLEIEPFSVAGADLGLVWCEVKVPADAAPGDYAGIVTVAAGNAQPLDLTVRLHVWDFQLPDRVQMPMLVWTGENAGDEFRTTARLFLEHHVDPVKAGSTMDFDELDKNLTFCLDRGLTYFETPRFKDVESFRPYYDHIKAKGWLDKALTYGARDEPLEGEFEEICVPKAKVLREAFPGLSIFLATQYFEGIKRGTDIQLFDLSTNFHAWLDAGRPGSQEPWWYFCGVPVRADLTRSLMDAPRMLIDRDAVEHRIVYWMAHHYGVKGLFTYAGTRWPAGNENWPAEPFKMNDKMHYPYAGRHNGDGFIVYPGPTPSIRLKTIRDGAEDYWYLAQVARLARSGKHVPEAQALLDGITPAVFVDTHYFNRDPSGILAYRHKLGEFIEKTSDRK